MPASTGSIPDENAVPVHPARLRYLKGDHWSKGVVDVGR